MKLLWTSFNRQLFLFDLYFEFAVISFSDYMPDDWWRFDFNNKIFFSMLIFLPPVFCRRGGLGKITFDFFGGAACTPLKKLASSYLIC